MKSIQDMNIHYGNSDIINILIDQIFQWSMFKLKKKSMNWTWGLLLIVTQGPC